MRQQISSTQTSSIPFGDDGSFDARDTGIIDVEELYFIFWLFAKEFVHLNRCIVNQIRGISKCAECQKIISSIIDYLNLFHSNLTCEYCRILFGRYGCKESIIQNNSPTMHIVIRLSCSQTKNIDKKVHILKNKMETVNHNTQHLNGELIRFGNSSERLSQECSSLQMDCQQQNTSISKLKLDQDMSEQNLLEIRKKMEDLHYATYDGVLIWKINEFKKKFHEAASGQKTSFYSPIFYSSTSGYKMRVRLDIYGDGDAQGTHMSISLVILKGEYDPILTWPFNYPVNFCLFDQTGEGHHIIDSFYPDTRSISFQRPTSKENTASGIIKFCPLAAIQQQENRFVQNDTMFIKIMVDFLRKPKRVLPYTLGLNPGLPIHVQEDISRREIEQHNQLRAALIEEIHRSNQEVAQRSLIHMHPPVPAGIRQQPLPATTNSQSISCEDISDDE